MMAGTCVQAGCAGAAHCPELAPLHTQSCPAEPVGRERGAGGRKWGKEMCGMKPGWQRTGAPVK